MKRNRQEPLRVKSSRSYVPTSVCTHRYMKFWVRIALGLAPIFVVSPARAQTVPGPSMNIPEASSKRGFDWGVSLGLDYVTGAKCTVKATAISCSSDTSTAFAVPASVMAQFDRIRIQLTVPFVDIEGPGTVGGVLGMPEIVGSSSDSLVKRRSGLGDVSVGAALILLREGRVLPRIEMAGVVKLPTGRDGLGTGKTDYGAQVSFYRPILKGVTTFGSLGYQWVGDPNTVKLHTGARGAAGLDLKYGILGAGALLDWRQSVFPGLANSFTVDPYVTLHVIGGVGVQVYTTVALTRLSPNHAVGLRLVL